MEDSFTRTLYIPTENLVVCKADASSRIFGKLIDTGIDTILLVMLFYTLFRQFILTDIMEESRNLTIIIVVYQVITLFLNLIIPVLTKGQTIGKMMVHTRIIHIDGNVGTLIIFLIRQSFFTVVALLGQISVISDFVQVMIMILYIICIIGIYSDKHGRTLQDKFAKTIVVDDTVWKKYRERAFYDIDNPRPEVQESSIEESKYQETLPNDDELTDNESIINKEEIL